MTVTYRDDSGTWFDGATGLTADKVLTIPSGQVTGDLILVVAAWKTYTITAQIAGYTEITEFADGTTASGNGTGSMKVGAWYKIATSDPEANPTLDFSSPTTLVGEAAVIVFAKSLDNWSVPTFVTAAWPSQSSGTVNASSTVTVPSGGRVHGFIGISDDSTITFPSPAIGGAGVTWGSAGSSQTPGSNASTTTGNDMAAGGHFRGVTTGAAGVTLTMTITSLTAAETGSVMWVVLGDEAANQLVTPTTAALVATKFAPTVTASDHQLVTPTTTALTSATFAPTVTASDHQLVTPTTKALTATKYAPAVSWGVYMAAVLADSPVGYWRLGEPSGSTATDVLGANNGTYVTGTTNVSYDQTGALQAVQDDGAIYLPAISPTLAHITIPGTIDLVDGPLSVEWWQNASLLSSEAKIFDRVGSGAFQIHFASGVVKLSGGGLSEIAASTVTDTTGVWHHYVATKNGSAVKIWRDGIDVTGTVTNETYTANSGLWRVGRRRDSESEAYRGYIDEIAFYSTVLSGTRVLAHYNAGVGPQVATPTTKALTLATFVPTITTSDHQLVTPTTKAAVLATFAPTVTASDHQAVTPTTKAVTLVTFAPTVTATDRQLVTPSTTALSLQAFAPAVAATDHQAVTPTTKTLTLATFAPVVSTPQTVTPAAVSLALATFVPTVSNPDPQLVTPTTKTLTLSTFAPSVGVSDAASIVPPNAALSLTTYAPTVIQPNPQLVTPTTPALELHTFEPVVTATAHQAVTPTTAAVVTTRHIPTVAATANQSAIPTTKALTLTAYAPQVTVNNIVATVTIGLTLTTFAPTVTATTGSYVFPGFATLTLTGYAPFIDLSAFKLVTPATAVLVITTYPPTAEQHSITPLPTPIYGFAIVATGPGAGVEGGNGGATVQPSGRGSTTVRTSGPSAKVTIR